MERGCLVVSLYYDPCDNTITHEDGRVIDDLSNLISYKELEYLKRVGGTKYIQSDEVGVMYEIVAPIPDYEDGIITFYYDKEYNVMLNVEGYVVYNMFAYVRPYDLLMFKKRKMTTRVYGKGGYLVDLIY